MCSPYARELFLVKRFKLVPNSSLFSQLGTAELNLFVDEEERV